MKNSIKLALLFSTLAFGALADTKISQMPNGSPLQGSEIFPMVQNGINATTSPNAIRNFIGGGLGSISLLTTSCSISGGPITSSGNVSVLRLVNSQSGTAYSLVSGDCGKFLTANNGATVTFTLLAPATAGNGYWFNVQNLGAGSLVLSPASGQINGTSTLALASGQGAQVTTDGANYFASATTAGTGTGSVTSVGLALPGSTFSISNSPVGSTGTLTGAFLNQSANRVLVGPATGAATTPTWRALVGADLPAPASTTLGGIESFASITHQFLTGISTLGVPVAAQPACADISNAGSVCPANTSTSGHNVPFLDGGNTWSGTQAFSAGIVDHVCTISSGTTYTVDSGTSGCSTADHLICLNTSGTVTVTLPASPVNGREILVADCSRTSGTLNDTINAGGGATINGGSGFTFNSNGEVNAFTYIAAITTWIVH